jgi:hypothetical protein
MAPNDFFNGLLDSDSAVLVYAAAPDGATGQVEDQAPEHSQ